MPELRFTCIYAPNELTYLPTYHNKSSLFLFKPVVSVYSKHTTNKYT